MQSSRRRPQPAVWAENLTRRANQRHNFIIPEFAKRRRAQSWRDHVPRGWTVEDLRPYVDHVLARFGTDRVLWGSDWPVLTLASSYADWLAASETLLQGLSQRERDAILGGNAQRFYGLD